LHYLVNSGQGSGSKAKVSSSEGVVTEVGGVSGSVDTGDGGSVDSGDGGGVDSGDGGGGNVGDSLDGVGSGLMDNGLVDGLVGPDGAGDGDLSVDGDILEDGLGNMVGLDDGSGLVGGNGGGDVGVGGLSHGVGQGGDLGDDLSEGMSLSGGVSEVSSKSVVLDGSRVVSWGTDKVGGCVTHNSSSWCHSDGASTGKSDERGEKQEGVHGGSR